MESMEVIINAVVGVVTRACHVVSERSVIIITLATVVTVTVSVASVSIDAALALGERDRGSDSTSTKQRGDTQPNNSEH